jgi:hypothetical protein
MIYYKYVVPVSWVLPAAHLAVCLGSPAIGESDGDPVFDTSKQMVDVLWESAEQEPAEWVSHRVQPETHSHWFAGLEGLWEECNP